MPVVKSLMDNLTKRYGPEKGERVYYAMEASGRGPFAAGGKYRGLHEDFAAKHGIPAIGEGKRKARRRRKR